MKIHQTKKLGMILVMASIMAISPIIIAGETVVFARFSSDPNRSSSFESIGSTSSPVDSQSGPGQTVGGGSTFTTPSGNYHESQAGYTYYEGGTNSGGYGYNENPAGSIFDLGDHTVTDDGQCQHGGIAQTPSGLHGSLAHNSYVECPGR